MKKSFLYGVTALGLIFTACQSDNNPIGPDSLPTEGDRTFYVNINIHGDVDDATGSRASDDDSTDDSTDVPTFSSGTQEENAVVNAYFVFYDIDGNQVGGQPVPVDLSKVTWNPGTESVEKTYQSVVGVTVVNGQENPAQVICYLNPQTPDELTKPLSEIQTATRSALTTVEGGKTYFSMSNSVFYPTTSSEAPQIAVHISPSQLFNTRKAAEDALNDESLMVDIYVERYAAKLSFGYVKPKDYETETRGINSTTGTDVTLSFDPKKWILNASCEESYVVKSFREEDATTGNILADNYSYAELNAVINKNGANWQWNNPAKGYNRSYWAMSPAYFTAEYPEVSSDVDEELNQKYYSYNELITGLGGKAPVGYELPELKLNSETKEYVTKYVHETTVGSNALNSKNIVAAMPSVILVGDYKVKVGTQDTLPSTTNFYTYGVVSATNDKPLVYFDADAEDAAETGATSIEGGESILLGLIKAATNLYKKVEDKYLNFDLTDPTDIQTLVAVLEVDEPSVDVKGNLKVPERYRTLQFKKGATVGQLDGIYVGTSDGYKTVLPSNDSATTPGETNLTWVMANQELMNVVGFCAKYNAGAAYFNIPVKHYGWYRAANDNNKTEAKMDWTKVRVGDFGIVRNHTYTIDVTEILGLGTGIGGKGNPIVPPAEENRYYLAYRINILKWAFVPLQSVKL